MNKEVRALTLFAAALVLGTYLVAAAYSQEKSAPNKTTVTGCLQKGDELGEYSIAGTDGKTYGLRSKTVSLSKHLGHKVTVTGTLRPESAEKEKAEAQETRSNEVNEAGDISVNDLQMVSEKCQ